MAKLEITEEMLDAIEAVKGRRNPNYWDPECRKYYEAQQNPKKDVKKSEKGYHIINTFFYCHGYSS